MDSDEVVIEPFTQIRDLTRLIQDRYPALAEAASYFAEACTELVMACQAEQVHDEIHGGYVQSLANGALQAQQNVFAATLSAGQALNLKPVSRPQLAVPMRRGTH